MIPDGVGNYFYSLCADAIRGRSDYELVFIPWFWQSEYRSVTPDEFHRTPDEDDYADLVALNYDGLELTDGQILFRREKISELGGEVDDFRREYPATIQEAFESSGHKQLVPSKLMDEAMRKKDLEESRSAPIIFGVDCARFGDDKTVLSMRRGRKGCILGTGSKMDSVDLAAFIKHFIEQYRPDAVFVDIGMGYGAIDILHSWGFDEVKGIGFGEGAMEPDKYTNRRNEMYGNYTDWMRDGPVEIDYHEALYMDSCAAQYKMDMKDRKVMESKDQIKDRLGNSPDHADSFVLTFAEPVVPYDEWEDAPTRHEGRSSRTGY